LTSNLSEAFLLHDPIEKIIIKVTILKIIYFRDNLFILCL